MQWPRRILVHLCCVVIATPLGWCCWLPAAPAPEKAERGASCCSRPKPAPAKPTETPQLPPNCCCEAMPALAIHPDQKAKEAAPVFAIMPAEAVVVPAPALVRACRFIPDPSPPLHVLHCHWIC